MSLFALLAKMRVRTKIIGVIGIIALLVLGGSWFATDHMAKIDGNYSKFLENDAAAWVGSVRVARNVYEGRYLLLRVTDGANAETRKGIETRIDATFEQAAQIATEIKGQSVEFAAQADKIVKEITALREVAANVTQMSSSGFDVQAKEELGKARPQFDQLSAETDKLREDLSKSIKQGSGELSDTTNATIRLTWLVMGGILLGGALLGLLVSRFGITRPLSHLVGVLQKMAAGEEVAIVGAGRKDEIGDTARAVVSIRTMLAAKAEREAQEKAEADRQAMSEKAERDRVAAEEKTAADQRAAAEREAATAKVMNEFDAAVGGIVKAAMDGDFSQRVPLEGKEGVIRNLATALNAMCDTTGAVLDDMVTMMSALAEGDLTRRIEAEYHGTFATLKESANTTAERLAQTVADIKAAALEVSNAAAEIATSSTDLSQRTEQQAAGLEETSASMEEMAATVKKNAENARNANQLTSGTRDVADRGGKVVATAVEAMSRIEGSSQKISDIIGVIDEIARQTNLLALNAAVEAARAGDAGRGFAVVASEVRSLAQRSSQAAKDIKDLITNSNMQVKQGVELVSKAGVSLSEIVQSIKSVADIVADIASASSEQSTGIDQVNKALTQMDQVTQQNSALVEENAATAKTLETQSRTMTDRIAFFQLAAGSDVVSSPTMSVPPAVKAVPSQRAAVKPRSSPAPAPAKRSVVGRMPAAIATALKTDPDWEEF